MAGQLAQGLRDLGLEPRFPVQANGVFALFPAELDRALRAAGHAYYGFDGPDGVLVRLMCSFDTQADDVERFVADARAALIR